MCQPHTDQDIPPGRIEAGVRSYFTVALILPESGFQKVVLEDSYSSIQFLCPFNIYMELLGGHQHHLPCKTPSTIIFIPVDPNL